MTKRELRAKLEAGEVMDSLFCFTGGQECLIFKADEFKVGEEIVYIPDIDLNGLPMDEPVAEDKIDDVLSCCYTGNDFVQECKDADVSEKYAERLFWLCDWQHPSSVLGEGWPDED